MLTPRKRFGQHFLMDEQILAEMIAAIGLNAEDEVIEIGPGEGALTKHLLPLVKQLTVIEIDRDLVAQLTQQFATNPSLTIVSADVLQFDWGNLLNTPQRIIGNLPYNITTPLIFKLLGLANIIDMHFLLQKEVVDRLTAVTGSSQYGRLTIMTQYHAQITRILEVPAQSFFPVPKVESAFVRITPHAAPPFLATDYQLFSKVVQEAFNYRRKTIANGLRKIITVSDLEKLNIDPHWRPQQITVENFVKISNILSSSQFSN